MGVFILNNYVINKNKCVSCMACYSVCPVQAIEILTDEDGFYFPSIKKDKCIKCGRCTSICPINNENNRCFNKKIQVPEIYACTINNYEIKMNSSSGGMFSILADYTLKANGYICGCILDNNLKTIHIVSNKYDDIKKMQGSKYIQSNIGNCFLEIKKLLEENKLVLFSGTPCQVTGLNAFLGKDYDNLISIDLVCTCVNPPYLLKEYVDSITGNDVSKLKNISFRNKITGWKEFSFLIEWLDNAGNRRVNYDQFFNGLFFKGFLTNLWMKNACEQCPYGNMNRASDFTLGDFWNIEEFDTTISDNKGLSLVMLNTLKSQKIFSDIKSYLETCKNIDYNWAINSQPVISGKGYYKHKNQDKYFKYVANHYSPIDLTKDLLGINKVGILTYDFSINYGAHLQAWALCKKIEDLGFTPKIIRWAEHYKETLGYENDTMKSFREKYLPRTIPIYTEEELQAEIWDCNRIVIGGDQVFRNWQMEDSLPITRYFGDFVFGNKVLASYGASFGLDFFNGSDYLINECKKLLKRFDKIGVREQSGVDILKYTFDVKGSEVIDPVFLQEKEEYEKIIAAASDIYTPEFKYLAYMVLDGSVGFADINKNLTTKLNGINIININANKNGDFNSIEQWLNYIKNAEFIITDSFHCVAICIIFEKPFIVINRDYGGTTRIKNILNKFNLQNHFKNTLDDINTEDIAIKIDWTKVREILKLEKDKSNKYLLEILLLKPNYKPKYENENLTLIRSHFESEYKNRRYNQVIQKLQEQEQINKEFSKSLDMIWERFANLQLNFDNLIANIQTQKQWEINEEFAKSLDMIWTKEKSLQVTVECLNNTFNKYLKLNQPVNTWKDNFEYQEFYKERYKYIVSLLKLDKVKSLMDLGSGPEFLREFLSEKIDYFPVDYLAKTPNTIIRDFNKGEFLNKRVDVIIMAGLLGYIYDLDKFIEISAQNTDCIIASYMFPDLYPSELGKTIHVNCLNQKQLFKIFKKYGFKITMKPVFNKNFTIFVATKRKVNFLKYNLIFKNNLISPLKIFYETNKEFLGKIFSIKNEYSKYKKHKVINILGLKIKLKQRGYKLEDKIKNCLKQ